MNLFQQSHENLELNFLRFLKSFKRNERKSKNLNEFSQIFEGSNFLILFFDFSQIF